jgi:CxxC motif-containing protein (DUF1111 family)
MKTLYTIGVLVFLIIVVGACEKILPGAPADDELLDGPVAGLTNAQSAQFLRGDIAFNDQIFTAATGLGSIFVATSCGSCHAGDGKGHPSTTLTRFGQIDETGNKFLHLGGPQLQNRALPGFEPEQIPAGATFSKFTPPANTRFGKKAGAYNLLHQTVNAYNQDMGITSTFEPYDVYSHLETDPEVSNQTVNDVVFYLQTLKAPVQRNQQDAEVKYGKEVFINIGCESCHKQTLKTGASPVAALSYQEFHPYTDLLLHDMGSGLDDGYTEGSAKTYEWRTPALWGLGLSPNSQGGKFFLLHDGRATSIEDAIVLHGGEATKSKQKFEQLSTSDRNALLKFLKSL